MTSIADAPNLVRAPAQVRAARIRGIIYFFLAVGTYVLLASGTEGDVVFRLGDLPGDLDLTVSSAGTTSHLRTSMLRPRKGSRSTPSGKSNSSTLALNM